MKPLNPIQAAVRRSGIVDPKRRAEDGDTLIEVLMTLIVMSICVVALIVAFSTGISASVDHRNLSANDTVLRSIEEAAFYQIQQSPNLLYKSCAQASDYSTITYGAPTGYTVTMNPVTYWQGGTTFNSTCVVNGPQLISLTVTNPNGSNPVPILFVVDGLGGAPASSLTLASVSPNSGGQGVTFEQLTLTGTGFVSGSKVLFVGAGVQVLSTTYVTPTTLNASISLATATAGPSTVTVQNPDGTSSNAVNFTVTAADPGLHISAISTTMGDYPPDAHNTTWDAVVTVFVENGSGTPVANVVVTGNWSTFKIGHTGASTITCTTDSTGSCGVDDGWTDQFTAGSSTPAVFTVSNLVLTGDNYTSGINNPSCACGSVSAP